MKQVFRLSPLSLIIQYINNSFKDIEMNYYYLYPQIFSHSYHRKNQFFIEIHLKAFQIFQGIEKWIFQCLSQFLRSNFSNFLKVAIISWIISFLSNSIVLCVHWQFFLQSLYFLCIKTIYLNNSIILRFMRLKSFLNLVFSLILQENYLEVFTLIFFHSQ